MAELVTREILGRRLGVDPRNAAKTHNPVHYLILGDTKRVPLYVAPRGTKKSESAQGARS